LPVGKNKAFACVELNQSINGHVLHHASVNLVPQSFCCDAKDKFAFKNNRNCEKGVNQQQRVTQTSVLLNQVKSKARNSVDLHALEVFVYERKSY
jgi:hypothetical protein